MLSLSRMFEIFYHWNPLNIYGLKVFVEDLVSEPLRQNETLMEDGQGSCRRIKVPVQNSTLLDRSWFWLQVHCNKKGHLEAIDNLISQFYQKILEEPPQETEKLQNLYMQIEQLRSLKNDYHFVFLKSDASFIEERLKFIESHTYAMFSYLYKQKVIEEEEERRSAFSTFDEGLREKVANLNFEFCSGLVKAHFLMTASTDVLDDLFVERIYSIDQRLMHIEELGTLIDEIERSHEGKFTIPCIEEHLKRMRSDLESELRNLGIELESLIQNLVNHYHISPTKQDAKAFLDFLEVDPDKHRMKDSNAAMFHEVLFSEVKRMKKLFSGRRKRWHG